jgi:hypothetical protein
MIGENARGGGPWFGGSRVRIQLPGTDATLVGRVHGSDGGGRTRVIVDGADGEWNTSILVPNDRIVKVVER